jgi:hypothetical protein
MNFYVSTTGSDNNNGTITHPFKTLEGARDAIRTTFKNKKLNKNINVFIRGGNYFIKNTFNLENIDSGNKNFSITYKNYKLLKNS